MSAQMTREAATKLWDQLRDHFVHAEKIIIEIIEKRAWEPLGYGSFAEAWRDRLGGIQLTTNEIRAHVVYQLLAEGADEAEVNETLGPGSGVGIASIRALQRQRSNGVPASRATTVVRQHLRQPPSGSRFVRAQFTGEEYARFRELADAAGTTVSAVAEDAIRTAFEEMDRG